MNSWLFFLYALLMGLNAGCSSWRSAQMVCVPESALERSKISADPIVIQSNACSLSEAWWTLFNDEQLNQLMEVALARSFTLAMADTRIVAAQAEADRVRAALFPNLFWAADVSRQKLSKTGVIPFGNVDVPLGPDSQIPVYFTLYETSVNLTYDFDFWGKNQTLLKAALSTMHAKMADAYLARLMLGLSLADTYFRLQVNFKRKALAQELIANKTRSLWLISRRVQDSLDNAIAVKRAQIELSGAKRGLLEIEAMIEVAYNQLSLYLAGDFEEHFAVSDVVCKPLTTLALPTCLPLHLIAMRPDIRSQLWIIESGRHLMKAARLNFYPDFNIAAFFGFQTIHFQELFKWPSTYFNVDPAFNLPLFDGGLRLAILHASEVDYDLAIYQYNELILKAVKEVLDGIYLLGNAQRELVEYQDAFCEQKEMTRLICLRMKNSIGSELDYLKEESALLLAEDRFLLAKGKSLNAALSLIGALGGGYEVSGCEF